MGANHFIMYLAHYNCPNKKSKAEFTVEDGQDVMFHTQAGNKYTKKVKCEIEINLGETCEEMELTCSSFNLAKGSILSVKVGDGKTKKYVITWNQGEFSYTCLMVTLMV